MPAVTLWSDSHHNSNLPAFERPRHGVSCADMTDAPLTFLDDGPQSPRAVSPNPPWKLLIVDDEPDVHAMAKLLLRHLEFQGRPLSFFDAFSAAEAKLLCAKHGDIAVILLDVVMETDQAGLELVNYIRDDLGNRAVQIIISTGQPGMAPPLTVVSRYGVNDYHEKTDLTQQNMTLAVTKALRLYTELLPLQRSHEAQIENQRAGGLGEPKNPPAEIATDPRLAALTEREREVLKLLSGGDSNKVIALKLGVQEVTVKAHLRQIFSKLQVFNRTQAASIALRLNETERD